MLKTKELLRMHKTQTWCSATEFQLDHGGMSNSTIVVADKDRFLQVLTNLLIAAYEGHSKVIKISLSTTPTHICCQVRFKQEQRFVDRSKALIQSSPHETYHSAESFDDLVLPLSY